MKSWGVLIVGLVLGLAAGLVYAWVIAPPQYYDTYPPLLHKEARETWTRLALVAYGVEGNWERTQLRLQDMPVSEVRRIAGETLQQAIADGRPIGTLQRLADLAETYGVETMAIQIYTENTPTLGTPSTTEAPAPFAPTATPTSAPATPSPTPTPRPTLTPLPASIIPTPQPPAVYHIISQTLTCADSPTISVSLIVSHTVIVRRNATIEYVPVPGREVWLLWENGADRATTGFKPELGLGYADFRVEPGHVYKLYIDIPRGAPVSTVQVEPCTPSEGGGWISRMLIIRLEDNE